MCVHNFFLAAHSSQSGKNLDTCYVSGQMNVNSTCCLDNFSTVHRDWLIHSFVYVRQVHGVKTIWTTNVLLTKLVHVLCKVALYQG